MRLLVIEGTDTLVQRARERGWEVIVITRRVREDEFASPPDLLVEGYDGGFLDAAVDLARSRGADAILSLSEEGLLPASQLRERLALPGGNPPSVVEALRDKSRMRALLSGVPGLEIRNVSIRGVENLPAALATVGLPAVVKPRAGSSSVGIHFVRSWDLVPAVQESLADLGLVDLLVEEFLAGPEFSVEGLTTAPGRHSICGITDKVTNDVAVEIGHSTPSLLPPDDLAQSVTLVRRFLDTLGVEWGPTHTEVILTPHGPRIVESHDRIGGDKIRDMTAHASGVDLLEVTLDLLSGEVYLQDQLTPVGGAAIRFLSAPGGTVTGIELPDRVPATSTIVMQAAVGAQARPVRSSDDRAGYVITYSDDVRTAIAECSAVASAIRIITNPASEAVA